MESKPWFVYLLATVETPIHTYVGASVDVNRRLRQHNGELSGGARATSKVPGGWYRICYVSGFESEGKALRFEWYWKHRSKKVAGDPIARRQKALDWLLASDEWKACGLVVHYE